MEVMFNNGWPNHEWLFDRVNDLMKPHYFRARQDHEVPAADVFESEDGYHFYFEMPGAKPETVSVKVEDGTLIVEAQRQPPELAGKTATHRSERRYQKFHRAFHLPEQYAGQPVTASYKDGILEVAIARPAEARPVKIKVNLN